MIVVHPLDTMAFWLRDIIPNHRHFCSNGIFAIFMFSSCVLNWKIEWLICVRIACCICYFVLVLALACSWMCASFTFHDVRKRRRRICWRSLLSGLFIPRPGTRSVPRQAILDAWCYITYHYLSCMFYFWRFTKNWTKTIFDVDTTTSNIMYSNIIYCKWSNLGGTKSLATILFI